MTNSPDITVFEHDRLTLGKHEAFTEDVLLALQQHYGVKGVPYYRLTHRGVQFNEHVGVIQVGKILIEVLPKADKAKHTEEEEEKWRDTLIGMLKAIGTFKVEHAGSSNLKLKANHILDLYFALFLSEVEGIMHRGLIKKYRQTEGNRTALKGSLQFAQQIRQNHSHKERFYVRYTTYDTTHVFHQIIYKALLLIDRLNQNSVLYGRIGNLKLNFPEMPDLKVTESTFDRLIYNRKTEHYKEAMKIAELLLLNYHPDVKKGRKNVLALMFDMNLLWEKFVLKSLRKHGQSYKQIKDQTRKPFWKPEKGNRSSIVPDIFLTDSSGKNVVLDTKWKNLYGKNPSPEDLRQMFAYSKYFNARKVALIYPGLCDKPTSGFYLSPENGAKTEGECAVIEITVKTEIKSWQQEIYDKINNWVQPSDQYNNDIS